MKSYWVLTHCHWLRVTTSVARWAALPHAGLHTVCVAGAIGLAGLGGYALLPARPASALPPTAAAAVAPTLAPTLASTLAPAGHRPGRAAPAASPGALGSAAPAAASGAAAPVATPVTAPVATPVAAPVAEQEPVPDLPPAPPDLTPQAWAPETLPPAPFDTPPRAAETRRPVDVPEPGSAAILGSALLALLALARLRPAPRPAYRR